MSIQLKIKMLNWDEISTQFKIVVLEFHLELNDPSGECIPGIFSAEIDEIRQTLVKITFFIPKDPAKNYQGNAKQRS